MQLIHNPALANMSFEEWKKYKIEQEKKRTHGAEKVQDEALLDVYFAINRYCFNGDLGYIPMYFIPADLEAMHPDSTGLYGYGCIMISKPYYEAHGTDEDVITTVYHEAVHAFCDREGIQDTDGEKHLKAFADACREHGGRSKWENEHYGYALTKLNFDTLNKIKNAYK